jgi:Rps23 Pro-64 3,4-dihydroxylase Tpa1-like proline 4-hydroxylase
MAGVCSRIFYLRHWSASWLWSVACVRKHLPLSGVQGVAEIRQAVRGDRIHWLEQGQSAAGDVWLQQLEGLRLQLNQGLFLGLEDFEGHYALYPPGSFYQKHLDRFHDDDRRSISVVLYLNPVLAARRWRRPASLP